MPPELAAGQERRSIAARFWFIHTHLHARCMPAVGATLLQQPFSLVGCLVLSLSYRNPCGFFFFFVVVFNTGITAVERQISKLQSEFGGQK